MSASSTQPTNPNPIPARPPVHRLINKSIISKLALELIVVIAGVLIALLVDNQRENFRERQLLESTMQSLSNEFSRNAGNIRATIPRQTSFLDTLRHYRAHEHLSFYDLASKTNGFGRVDIYTTNWQATLSSNNLHFLNFRTVTLLSRIEAKHEAFQEQQRIIDDRFFGPALLQTGKDGYAYRLSLELWLGYSVNQERELLKLYQEFAQIVRTRQYQR